MAAGGSMPWAIHDSIARTLQKEMGPGKSVVDQTGLADLYITNCNTITNCNFAVITVLQPASIN
jgi:hypothetical protein